MLKKYFNQLLIVSALLLFGCSDPQRDALLDEESVSFDPPEIESFDGDTIGVGDTLVLFVQATDKDAAIAEYYWDLGQGWIETDTVPFLRYAWSTEGQFTVSVMVRDANGVPSESHSAVFVVKANAALPALVRSIGDTLTLRGRGYSADMVESFAWDIGGTGSFVETSKEDTLITLSQQPVPNFIAILRVTQKDGRVMFDRVRAAVLLDAPTLDLQVPAGIEAGQSFQATSNAKDSLGSIVSLEWRADTASTGQSPWVSGDTVQWIQIRKPGTYKLHVRIMDDDSLEARDSISIAVVYTKGIMLTSNTTKWLVPKDKPNMYTINNPGSAAKELIWDFGDGKKDTTTLPQTSHVYACDSVGGKCQYSLRVHAIDSLDLPGPELVLSVQVNAFAPSLSNLTVQFRQSYSNAARGDTILASVIVRDTAGLPISYAPNIVRVDWRLDAGEWITGTPADTSRAFVIPKDFNTGNANLYVRAVDADSNSTTTQTTFTVVTGIPTLAALTDTIIDIESPTALFKVPALSDTHGKIDTVLWKFGDGQTTLVTSCTASGSSWNCPEVQHSYTAVVDTHAVVLRVVDDRGNAVEVTRKVRVQRLPPQVTATFDQKWVVQGNRTLALDVTVSNSAYSRYHVSTDGGNAFMGGAQTIGTPYSFARNFAFGDSLVVTVFTDTVDGVFGQTTAMIRALGYVPFSYSTFPNSRILATKVGSKIWMAEKAASKLSKDEVFTNPLAANPNDFGVGSKVCTGNWKLPRAKDWQELMCTISKSANACENINFPYLSTPEETENLRTDGTNAWGLSLYIDSITYTKKYWTGKTSDTVISKRLFVDIPGGSEIRLQLLDSGTKADVRCIYDTSKTTATYEDNGGTVSSSSSSGVASSSSEVASSSSSGSSGYVQQGFGGSIWNLGLTENRVILVKNTTTLDGDTIVAWNKVNTAGGITTVSKQPDGLQIVYLANSIGIIERGFWWGGGDSVSLQPTVGPTRSGFCLRYKSNVSGINLRGEQPGSGGSGWSFPYYILPTATDFTTIHIPFDQIKISTTVFNPTSQYGLYFSVANLTAGTYSLVIEELGFDYECSAN